MHRTACTVTDIVGASILCVLLDMNTLPLLELSYITTDLLSMNVNFLDSVHNLLHRPFVLYTFYFKYIEKPTPDLCQC